MGSRGPQKTPTAIKKARGTHRADRDLPGDEPEASKRAPKNIPDTVAGRPVALACWQDTLPSLSRMKILSADDVLALEALCLVHADEHDAQAEISKHGLLVIGGHGGLVANPAVAMLRQSRLQKMRLLSEFGLTPAARTRVRAQKADEKPKGGKRNDPKSDPEGFLFGGPKLMKAVGA